MATGTHEGALPPNHHLKNCHLIENSQDFLFFFFFFPFKIKLQFFRRSTRKRKETETFEQLPYQQNPRMPQPHVTASRISCSSLPNKWLRQSHELSHPSGSNNLLLSCLLGHLCCPQWPLNPWVRLLPGLHHQRTESFDTFLPRKPQQLPQTI